MIRRTAISAAAILLLQGCASPSGFFAQPQHSAPVTPVAVSADGITAQNQAPLYLNVIDGLVKQTHYGAALAFLDDYAVKKNSLTPRYWLLRGDALQGLGRGPEASIAYARLDSTPLAADGWNGKGRIAATQQQWRTAAGNFQKAVLADPSNADFLNNMAFAQIHSGQPAAAAGYLRQAHELNPGSKLIRNNLIIALTLTGNRAGADALLKDIDSDTERENAKAIVKSVIENNSLAMNGKFG